MEVLARQSVFLPGVEQRERLFVEHLAHRAFALIFEY